MNLAIKNSDIINKNIKKVRDLWLKCNKLNKNLAIDSLFSKQSLDLINLESILQGFAPLGLKVQIPLNIGCNAHCIMCDGRKYNPFAKFDYDSVLELIDYLDDATVSSVRVLGGEPLLDREGFLKVIKKCKIKNIKVSTNTNAYFLDEAYIDTIIKNGINEIGIALHGLGYKHDLIFGLPGLFEKVKKILIYIREKYPHFKVTIETVIMKENYKEIPKIGYFIDNCSVQCWILKKLENFNRNYDKLKVSSEDIRKLFQVLSKIRFKMKVNRFERFETNKAEKKGRCNYLLHKININDQGKIIPCNEVDGNYFYLDKPIKELYKNLDFINYLLHKINNCKICR